MKGIIDLIGSLIGELLKGSLSIFGEIINSFLQKDHSLKAEFGNRRNVLHASHTGIAIGSEAISLAQSLEGGGLILGKSGSGKSSKVFKTQLLRAPKGKTLPSDPASLSYVVLDPSGELYRDCAGYLIEQGYEIDIINFSDSKSATSSWNPVSNLQDHEISRIASDYIATAMNSGSSKSDPFWDISASRLLTFTLHFLRLFDVPFQNLYNARFVLEIMSGQPAKIDMLMALPHIPDALFNQYLAIQNMGEKVQQSVVATVIASLQHFSDPNIVAGTSTSTLDMDSYRTHSKVLFIQNSIMSQEYVSSLNSLLFSAWFTSAMRSLPKEGENTLVFVIDEASSLQKMKANIIPLASSNLRKHNSFGIFGYQSFFQAEQMLGHQGAMTLKQNVGTCLYLTNQDHTTAREISERLGKYNYTDEKGVVRERSLLTADEVTFLSKGGKGGILFSGHERGILLPSILPYYEIPKYRKRSEQKAPHINGLTMGTSPLLPIDLMIADAKGD